MTHEPDFDVVMTERTYDAIRDEQRSELRRRAEERDAILEEISPVCVSVLATVVDQEITCGHKLRHHDPCTDCGCPAFVDADGRDAATASAALIEAHADLFGKGRD